MARYAITLDGSDRRITREIPAGKESAETAKEQAKHQANLFRDKAVLIYRWNVVYKRWESWQGFQWNDRRGQVEGAHVTKATWDANLPEPT